MEELRYRENDRFFPIPENEKDIPAIRAEHFIDIPTEPVGFNILEGLCFDGTGKLHRMTLLPDRYTIEPASSYVAYHFTGLEGPDSTVVDEDGNLYVAICGQARFLVFNRNGYPIGQILVLGRERGEMAKSTHLTIRPGTNEAYICAADLNTGKCAIYTAKVFSNAYKSYQFQ